MPKLIDYPRTSYAGAWEVADVVDDTGGKCALDTCARKLNRKVSGSFKAIVGSAVKFGLLTSKRELLTTTTLFRRIKHAYDKQEELIFHREAFLTPPLFTQLCRKFRSRELPVQMLDIMLIREFDVEEINAQGVAKAFTDGARMVGLLDEHNIVADVDQLAAQQPPRRELASPELGANSFRSEVARTSLNATVAEPTTANSSSIPASALFQGSLSKNRTDPALNSGVTSSSNQSDASAQIGASTELAASAAPLRGADAVANLFGLSNEEHEPGHMVRNEARDTLTGGPAKSTSSTSSAIKANSSGSTLGQPLTPAKSQNLPSISSISTRPETPAMIGTSSSPARQASPIERELPKPLSTPSTTGFRIELSGPGINTVLDVQDEDDLLLAKALLEKIGRQLRK